MSIPWRITRVGRRRPFVCADCRAWLAEQSPQGQRRNITYNHLRRIQTSEDEWQNRRDAVESGQVKSILEKLEERGLVNQVVGNRDELQRVLVERRVGVYCGVDPTAQSLHVGHIVPFMALGWMYIHGYSSTFLLGGFTAKIGDPTDRLSARTEQAASERKKNMANMFEQLKRLAASMEKYAERRGFHREWAWRRSVINNSQWWTRVSVSDYMTRLGKYMRIGPMLGRDSVKNRLEKGDGMSYSEFSYPLIQGWDWWEMFKTGTQIQIGGADQFGNILAGTEAVKSIMAGDEEFQVKHQTDMKTYSSSGDPMGFTVPLLTTASGEKFGKSAGNAVWLDQQLMNSFDLYQYFLRSSDEDVEKYLRLLTFLPMQEIRSVMAKHQQDPSQRIAQHKLAMEFVELVHGLGNAQEAEKKHRQAFSKDLSLDDIRAQTTGEQTSSTSTLSHPSITKNAKPLDMETSTDVNIKLPRSMVVQQPLNRILWSAGLAASRSEGQRLINAGGVYIAGQKSTDGQLVPITDKVAYVPAQSSKWADVEPLVIDGDLLILRTGKWKKKFITIVSDEAFESAGLTCPGWEQDEVSLSEISDVAEEERQRRLGEKNRKTSSQRRMDQRSMRSGGYGEVTGARFRDQSLDN